MVIRRIINLAVWTYRHGTINLYHRVKHTPLWKNQVIDEFKVQSSSMTDSFYLSTYPSLCALAANNDVAFKTFRSAQTMVEALDHVSIEQANLYILEILKKGLWNPEFTEVINKIDSLGNPRKYRFPPYGTFSPTLLRYLKVYMDLKIIFGELDEYNIAEIGIGFGGQASLISLLDSPISFTLYDLPPVLELASRFMESLDSQGDFRFLDGRIPTKSAPDLVISNYAFSELNRDIQDEYLNKVILNAARGYITWNRLSEESLGGHSLASLMRLIPNSEISPESPNTFEGNVIITWRN